MITEVTLWDVGERASGPVDSVQARELRDRTEVPVTMPDRYAILDRNCRDQTIRSRSHSQSSPPSEAIDGRRFEKQTEWKGIAQNRNCQKCGAELLALHPGAQSLKHLLNDRAASDKPHEILFSNPAAPPPGGQQFDPNRRVYEDHRPRRGRPECRGRSSLISDSFPSQIPDPKNCGRLWIFRSRTTSSRAVFTAAEYVFAPRILVARVSSSSSSTRFVRFMCIV